MSKDKAEKKLYVENRWIPAVNVVQEKYKPGKWHFIEIANDICETYGIRWKTKYREIGRAHV